MGPLLAGTLLHILAPLPPSQDGLPWHPSPLPSPLGTGLGFLHSPSSAQDFTSNSPCLWPVGGSSLREVPRETGLGRLEEVRGGRRTDNPFPCSLPGGIWNYGGWQSLHTGPQFPRPPFLQHIPGWVLPRLPKPAQSSTNQPCMHPPRSLLSQLCQVPGCKGTLPCYHKCGLCSQGLGSDVCFRPQRTPRRRRPGSALLTLVPNIWQPAWHTASAP